MDYVITIAHGTIFRFRLAEFLRAVFWLEGQDPFSQQCGQYSCAPQRKSAPAYLQVS